MRVVPGWSGRHPALFLSTRKVFSGKAFISTCAIPYPKLASPAVPLARRSVTNSSLSPQGDGGRVQKDQVGDVHLKDRLKEIGFDKYPRISRDAPTGVEEFRIRYEPLQKDTTESTEVQVAGRVSAMRTAGSKLAFIDIVEHPGDHKLQIVLVRNHLSHGEISGTSLKELVRSLQRGDLISVRGHPHRTAAGELSIRALELPTLLSPCLHQIPEADFGKGSDWAHDKHVEMLSRPEVLQTIVVRSIIIQVMQQFLSHRGFVMVQTPILAAAAGGATARPFETAATEFPDRKLTMRVAPELWLKRLLIGGMRRVAEVGSSFRNEGLDKTHNPEFTTCEFYATYWSLQKLQQTTQEMFRQIAFQVLETEQGSKLHQDVVADALGLHGSEAWPELDFIPALNTALNIELPNLAAPDARDLLLQIFAEKGLLLPSKPTLPRLVDKLSSIYLEPHCRTATWIKNPPECLSPLAKSFIHPTAPNSQPVAARAELFIQCKEFVNCYEEENSPIEQRRKFNDQQISARLPDDDIPDDEAMKIDEDYLRALEWGLPPTGGWGCGIDRLVMMFTGKERINDVLTFGNLREVTRSAERWDTRDGKAETRK